MKRVWIKSKGAEALPIQKAISAAFKKEGFELVSTPKKDIDLCLSVGGDGTFLAALRELEDRRFEVPVLGIHGSHGRGFLLPLKPPQEDGALLKWTSRVAQTVKEGHFKIDERWGLVGTAQTGKGKVLYTDLWGLNDIVVTRSTLSRLVWLKISVDDRELLPRFKGDGFIVSSASGSTAYSLSAGGPVLHPSLKNVLITPICPQSLAHRSVVLNEDSSVRIEILENDTPSYLTNDGQAGRELLSGSFVQIQRAKKSVKFVVPTKLAPMYEGYFQVLREKLGFGGQ